MSAQGYSPLCTLDSSGGFKPTEVWVPPPEILVWDEAQELGALRCSPSDSEMQPGLRSTELREEEGLLSKEAENIGDLLMLCREFFKGTVESFLELGGWEVGGQVKGCTQIPWGQEPRSRQWPGNLRLLVMTDVNSLRGHYGKVLLEGLVTLCHRSCVYCCEGLAMNTDG